jgi:hypothetical protein
MVKPNGLICYLLVTRPDELERAQSKWQCPMMDIYPTKDEGFGVSSPSPWRGEILQMCWVQLVLRNDGCIPFPTSWRAMMPPTEGFWLEVTRGSLVVSHGLQQNWQSTATKLAVKFLMMSFFFMFLKSVRSGDLYVPLRTRQCHVMMLSHELTWGDY